LGYLIVDFHAETLIDECFHTRIQSEFNFMVQDGDGILFKSSEKVREQDFDRAATRSSIEFPVRNRTWRLTMMPKEKSSAASGWTASISVPLLGLLLSVGLSWLVYLLSRRMEMYRSARDTALTEVEERQKAEAALKASESRYRNVFDSATDGLLVLEPDGLIAKANPAAGAIHNYNAEEIVGRPIQSLIAPDFQHKYLEFKRQLDQRGAARLDSVDLRKDGSRVDIEVRGTQMMDGDDLKHLAIITDVSERKRAMERHALLSRKAIAAQEEERARLSMELHDELGQLLTAIRLEMGWLHKQISAEPLQSGEIFQNTIALVEKATDELRRICKGLRPPLLDDLGLEPAVRQLVAEFQERSGIEVDLVFQLDEREKQISKEIAICAYRILQESLTNALKHSKSKNIDISLADVSGVLELTVYDDGVGFDITKLKNHQGYGLDGMTERSNLVNGTLEIRSIKDQGTRVVFRVPLGA
jgi:PAS domain S-box-containing protein